MLEELLGEQKINNIRQDSYDATLFNELLSASGTLKDILSTPPIAREPWKAIVQDFFVGYYKFTPELAPESEVKSLYRANRPFIEKFLEDPITEQTRIYTRLDNLSAGMATIAAAQKLNQELNNRPELREKIEKVCQESQGNDNADKEAADKLIKDINGLSRDLRRVVRQAAEAGETSAENLKDGLNNWGLDTADLQTVPMGKRLELAEFLINNPRVKNLSGLIGRMRSLARSRQREKVKTRRDDIHSVTVGNDLAHVLPVELAGLNHPLLKLEFARKYTEGSLLQYELKSNDPQGRGPIVGAVDISYSMEDKIYEHSKIDLAIATILSLIDTASRQKRSAFIIFFNGAIVKELEFLPKEKNVEKFLQLAQIGASGGTNYQPPLKRALEIMNSAAYQKADLVFITDGECKLPDEFLSDFQTQKSKLSFKCYTVLIGFMSNQVKQWADQIWQTLDDSAAGDIFEAVF